jgi:VCBS repeat-containing protein
VANADAYTTTATATSPSLGVAAPGVLGNDSSPSGKPLTAVLVTGPTKLAGGSFTLNANGSFAYWTKNLTATTDTFTYRASDGTLQSAAATVTITITAHPAPVANDDTFACARNSSGITLTPLTNDTATNATIDPATITKLSNPSRGGTATVNLNGTITYKPAKNFKGTDVFTYNVKDTLGATSNTGTIRVNVQ